MPNKCSIISCNARTGPNGIDLTFHRLPQSKHKQKIWLDLIGEENIRTDLKVVFICSMHFEEKSFNRTLNVIRLRDDAVPSLFLQQPSTQEQLSPAATDDNSKAATDNNSKASQQIGIDKILQELKRLQDKVFDKNKKIKCLNETVRRQKIKMATYKNVINELKELTQLTD